MTATPTPVAVAGQSPMTARGGFIVSMCVDGPGRTGPSFAAWPWRRCRAVEEGAVGYDRSCRRVGRSAAQLSDRAQPLIVAALRNWFLLSKR